MAVVNYSTAIAVAVVNYSIAIAVAGDLLPGWHRLPTAAQGTAWSSSHTPAVGLASGFPVAALSFMLISNILMVHLSK